MRAKKELSKVYLRELIKAGNDLLSRSGSIIGVTGLTAEFEMGSGEHCH